MNLIPPPSQEAIVQGFCGTSYAAKLLGISVGTVQSLVEKNELKAWKTQGGHRRISLDSVYDYRRRCGMDGSRSQPLERLRVMVVEDDPSTRLMMQAHFDDWSAALDVVMYESALHALMDMLSVQPQVLLTDLRMPHVDGFALLHQLKQHNLLQRMSVVVITGMSSDEIVRRGPLPDGVQLIYKPVDMDWLKGFFDALISVNGSEPHPSPAAKRSPVKSAATSAAASAVTAPAGDVPV
jgi:excisionase family DNA binding protein